jgi:hypothetical protein
MTVLEQAVKALCEALVRVTGGDVAAYRRRVEAAKGLTDDQLLEQVERQIRFRRRQVQEGSFVVRAHAERANPKEHRR